MNPVIKIENVRKILGKREVLKGISFAIEKGDIFGYLGPNGAGKTTTIRIILGLLTADSGRVTVLGEDINSRETRRKIGFALFPDGLYDNMTGEENLMFYARIYRVPAPSKRIDESLQVVGLQDRAADRAGTYSKGMRQRLALARALVHQPEVLILDEPTAGVDPSGQIEIRQILLDIASREKKTIFLSSHNLDEVQRICNRIGLIDRGEIKLYGDLEELRQKMGSGKILIKTGSNLPVSLLEELKTVPVFGFAEAAEDRLIFSPRPGVEVSDLVSFLTARGIRIEGATRQEASLEEIYSTILKEAEPK